jgi:hypothetical protein
MATSRVRQLFPLLGSVLGLVLMVWGLVLNLSGHESAQSWSLIGVGAAAFGSLGGVIWTRRPGGTKRRWY